MEIEGAQAIGRIFSIFHDGGIDGHRVEGDTLHLVVAIAYLAERVNPGFERFSIALAKFADCRFVPWLDDRDAVPLALTEPGDIFTDGLEVLQGESDGARIKVVLNQSTPGVGYCGGEWSFNAASALVVDQAGKSYSIDELDALSRGYWDAWDIARRSQ